MSEKGGDVWPDVLMIRDTKLHDDLGGCGQRVYTTAGNGDVRQKYVRADLVEADREELARLRAMMVEANGLLRSSYAIAARRGEDTNWDGFDAQIKAALERQMAAGIIPNTLGDVPVAPPRPSFAEALEREASKAAEYANVSWIELLVIIRCARAASGE